MIYTRSPYYVDIDAGLDANITRYEMRLFIWKGDINVVPTTPTHVFNNSLYLGKASVNISNYINDYFTNYNPILFNTNGVSNNTNVVCVRWEIDIIRTGTTPLVNFVTGSDFAIEGYTLFEEGRNFNPSPDSDFFYSFAGKHFKVYDTFLIGVNSFNGEHIVATSYPSNTVLIDEIMGISNNSNSRVKNIHLVNLKTSTDKYILLNIYGEEFIIELVKECKYEPVEIQFKNRYGTEQQVTFFKKSVKDIDVKRSEFNKKSYNRQINIYNTNARKSINTMSGYQTEDLTEIIEQLLLSEYVYIKKGANYIPYNVDTKSLTYKTKVNDKLINYELSFIEAFNTINNV